MNGHFQGSFAQYMEKTLKMGDVDFSKGAPVIAQNQIVENRYHWDPSSNIATNDTRPVSDNELTNKLNRAIDAGRVTEGSVVQVSIDTDGDGIHNHFTLGRVYMNNGQLSIRINDHSSSGRQDVDWLDLNHGSAEKGKGLNILRLFTTDVKAK